MISLIQVCRDKNKRIDHSDLKSDYLTDYLVLEGNNPSVLRNLAARKAKGQVLYFIDDDVEVSAASLEVIAKRFTDKECLVLGGPALIRKESLFSLAMISFFGFGPSCSRYRSLGHFREAHEQELILCNLAFDKKTFLSFDGFRGDIFPGEENELLGRMAQQDMTFHYDPNCIVSRGMTSSFQKFSRKVFSYGVSRGQRLPRLNSRYHYLYFVPMTLVLLALLSFIFVWAWPLSVLVMLGPYILLTAIASCWDMVKAGKPQLIAAYLAVLVSIHFCYGMGLWWGLSTTYGFGHFLHAGNRVNLFK